MSLINFDNVNINNLPTSLIDSLWKFKRISKTNIKEFEEKTIKSLLRKGDMWGMNYTKKYDFSVQITFINKNKLMPVFQGKDSNTYWYSFKDGNFYVFHKDSNMFMNVIMNNNKINSKKYIFLKWQINPIDLNHLLKLLKHRTI